MGVAGRGVAWYGVIDEGWCGGWGGGSFGKGGAEMKLPRLSGQQVIRALAKAGFHESRRHGSRVYLEKSEEGDTSHLMVHDFKELDPKALMDVIHQAGMNREEFLSLL